LGEWAFVCFLLRSEFATVRRMGLEAHCRCETAEFSGEVHALLEASELILRGAIRRHLPLAGLADIRSEGEALRFTVGGRPVSLMLGAARAATWARKMVREPPSLREKLGLKQGCRLTVIGAVDDAALREAIGEDEMAAEDGPTLALAVVTGRAALDHVLDRLQTLAVPVWIANLKGAASSFGENAVRAVMRERGYVDSKSISVSARLSATRYGRKRGEDGTPE
jgi:hypothetical protein